ncbi:MAG: LLM class flavin-dependent oxidoreductase [Actinomycetota bacterium]|jgi:alkanesulfonate monooxygenase SsuD/methylene tetrahydromethanopterin reductase-like flavin-dependent oxidoreductase (luciferase family)
MHVGMTAIFQGYGGQLSDRDVWKTDLALADLAEPLGFESIWGVEHHFTNYTMSPDVLQFLTYMAGRTTTVKLGSMVLVLPWHDTVRAAEQILLLDHMSDGRFILGLGRGTGKCEFDGLRVSMATARERFGEQAEALMTALETGVMEYDGQFVQQPRVELRPGPFKSFRNRIYSATVSPESAEIMAKLGTGVLIIPQKPHNLVRDDVETYRRTYVEAIGAEPPAPILSAWVYIDEDEKRARQRGRKFLQDYWDSVVAHYEFDKPHLKSTPGYEFHGQMYDRLTKPGGAQEMADFYAELHPYGTPDQVLEKITEFADLIGADGFLGVFRYGAMTREDGERNMRLFAETVMPELKKIAPASERLAASAA